MLQNISTKYLYYLLFVIVLFFIVLLFKNIQYPLLWNDEADTALGAERIIEFGYPKRQDGKNIFSLFEYKDKAIGTKESIDAYIGEVWGQYYFAVPFVKLAESLENHYAKTLLIRAPFVLVGFLGLAILSLLVIKIPKKTTKEKLLLLTLFFFLEASSVYLILHLRQARSHPLAFSIMCGVIFLFLYSNCIRKINVWVYNSLVFVLMLILFNVFYPAYAALLLSFLSYSFLTRKSLKSFFSDTKIWVFSVISIIPLVLFFEIPTIASVVTAHFSYSFSEYISTVLIIIYYFLTYDFLLPVLVLKVLSWVFFLRNRSHKITSGTKFNQISSFLMFFFFVYIFVIAKIPHFYFRYTIILQPILSLIFILDLALLMPFTRKVKVGFSTRFATLTYLLIAALVVSLGVRFWFLKQYVYEITEPYKGPLDYVISYIDKNYTNTEGLIIATNYEEQSYMYYLKSKVLVGFVGNSLEEDLKLSADIVIPRKYREENLWLVNSFLEKDEYQKVNFPVYDYPVNNIPQLGLGLQHLFKTPYTYIEVEQLTLYERQK